jgi:AraC-like DNA-binding protein
MKGNGQTNGMWQPSSPPPPDNGIIEALVRSDIYRKFSHALPRLTGFTVALLPADVAPLSNCTVPVCHAGQLLGRLQITCVEPVKPQNRRCLAAARLVEVFAKHLELISDQAASRQRNAEPPIIRRAKSFIHANHATDLSLSKTAISVNVSRFYFCKLFKAATGSTFTRYVSAVRIERARLLLLNQSLRVTEIAFDVGFRSLTHFNRVFRNVTGCSPTEYRRRRAISA